LPTTASQSEQNAIARGERGRRTRSRQDKWRGASVKSVRNLSAQGTAAFRVDIAAFALPGRRRQAILT
jgi:hypothetical protein